MRFYVRRFVFFLLSVALLVFSTTLAATIFGNIPSIGRLQGWK
jgi:hypothetical protein